MELEIEKQALSVGLAFITGAAAGTVYDLLRPVRHCSGKPVQAVLDILFCLSAFCLAFLFGQYTYKSRLGIWELAAMGLGFFVWMKSASPVFLRINRSIFAAFTGCFAAAIRLQKKTENFLKFFFQKVQ